VSRRRVQRLLPAAVVGLGVLLGVAVAWARAAGPELSLTIGGGEDGGRLSASLQIVLLLTIISLAPTLLIALTAFVRIVIVLAFVRQAIGTPAMPPGQVMIPLALFLTVFVMLPVFSEVHRVAVEPYLAEETTEIEALADAYDPLRRFMLRQTREKDLALFVDAAGAARPQDQEAVPAQVLIPAFMISEIKTAFQMGFLLFIPFLILDMVVASVLVSMGMMMLPPVLISLPFKLMLFVLVDGWNVLVGSLIESFH
jgi:flagellar biosynthetic protein FliP